MYDREGTNGLEKLNMYCSRQCKAIHLRFQQRIQAHLVVAVIYPWNKEKNMYFPENYRAGKKQRLHKNYFAFPHSLPQPARIAVVSSSWGAASTLASSLLPLESFGTLASLARCGAKECPVYLQVFAHYGPWPRHYTSWTAIHSLLSGLGTDPIMLKSSTCPASPSAEAHHQYHGNPIGPSPLLVGGLSKISISTPSKTTWILNPVSIPLPRLVLFSAS